MTGMIQRDREKAGSGPKDAQRDALLVRQALDAVADPALPSGLHERVLARQAPSGVPSPRSAARRPSIVEILRSFWPQAVGLATASFIGFAVGFADLGLSGLSDTDLTPYVLTLDAGVFPDTGEEFM